MKMHQTLMQQNREISRKRHRPRRTSLRFDTWMFRQRWAGVVARFEFLQTHLQYGIIIRKRK